MPEEKVYIGTKIIKAFPMSECEWLESKGEDVSNRDNQHGYCVTYEDGYKSWSPKATFEHAYREVSFSEKRFFV